MHGFLFRPLERPICLELIKIDGHRKLQKINFPPLYFLGPIDGTFYSTICMHNLSIYYQVTIVAGNKQNERFWFDIFNNSRFDSNFDMYFFIFHKGLCGDCGRQISCCDQSNLETLRRNLECHFCKSKNFIIRSTTKTLTGAVFKRL